MSLILTLLRVVLLIAALACAGVAIAAQGGRFSGRLDVLTHLTPLWLIAGVLTALAAAALSPDRYRAAPLLAAIVTCTSAILLMAPEFRPPKINPQIPPPPGPTLKVLQFNVWQDNTDPAATLAWILAQDADVVVLEESKHRSRSVLLGLYGAYPYRVTCTGTGPCSTMILSKTPPLAFKGLQTRDVPDRRPIAAAWARFDDPAGPYTVVALHLTWPMMPPGLQKLQLASLNATLDELPKDRMILAGDFNSTPWSFALRGMDRRSGLIRRTRALASWPATQPFPVLPIDQVYAGAGWRTVSVTRGPKLGSDHYPVVVVLAPVSP